MIHVSVIRYKIISVCIVLKKDEYTPFKQGVIYGHMINVIILIFKKPLQPPDLEQN